MANVNSDQYGRSASRLIFHVRFCFIFCALSFRWSLVLLSFLPPKRGPFKTVQQIREREDEACVFNCSCSRGVQHGRGSMEGHAQDSFTSLVAIRLVAQLYSHWRNIWPWTQTWIWLGALPFSVWPGDLAHHAQSNLSVKLVFGTWRLELSDNKL